MSFLRTIVVLLRDAREGAKDTRRRKHHGGAAKEAPPESLQMGPFLPAGLPSLCFHLTARPWRPLDTPREAYLDRIEGIARYEASLLDAAGGVIDPVIQQEWQYGTPCFAAAVGILVSSGRALELLPAGRRAMDHVTLQMSRGNGAIPQAHGNFFVAPMMESLTFYAPFVSDDLLQAWRERMSLPVRKLVNDALDINWRTYAMKGEWYRGLQGVVPRRKAAGYVEAHWKQSQRQRFAVTRWGLYHDFSCQPDTFAYDAMARLNLLHLLATGYGGPSSSEMKQFLRQGSETSLLLQDAGGQAPLGGRSGAHVWNDIVNGAVFELMAESMYQEGLHDLAGRFRRSAMMALRSADRWRHEDGFYFVTKNRFAPSLRTRYANYSQLVNYNGNMLIHMGEAFQARRTAIPEQPAPAEIGGYCFEPDTDFGMAFANAGGTQVQVTLKGSQRLEHDQYWNALGISRFSRVNWDGRLGPSDGIRDSVSGMGISYAPTFLEGGIWKRMASLPDRYEGTLTIEFAHPLLVRFRITYTPLEGHAGPTFHDDVILTPDGLLSTVTSSAPGFGVTWPVLLHDGETGLHVENTGKSVTISFPGGSDRQSFLALGPSPELTAEPPALRSSYGDLLAVRYSSRVGPMVTFVYPHSREDPSADLVHKSFNATTTGYSSCLGSVTDSIYIGRTAAGGWGHQLDLDQDGNAEIIFPSPCHFIVQLEDDRISAIESDIDTPVRILGKQCHLSAYQPRCL